MSVSSYQEDYEEEKKRLESLPQVSLPVITLEKYNEIYYAKINVKSWVLVDKKKNEIDIHEGFLFKITFRKNLHPQFEIVGEFPIIFHPHFKKKYGRGCLWVDYKLYDPNEKLSDYILRMAHSLKYDKGYISETPLKMGNETALKWYLNNRGDTSCFPIDNIGLPRYFEEKVKNRTFYNAQVQFPKTMSTNTSMPRKKFEVKKIEPPYQPEEIPLPIFKKIKEYSSKNSINASHGSWIRNQSYENHSSKHCLYIKLAAWKMIKHHIEWDHQTPNNMVEQGGILLGKAYTDADHNLTYGVVEQAIDGKSAKGSSAYLEMTHETWQDMFDRVDHFIANKDSKLQIIGWYHTHPMQLDVFMSGTDKATQSRLFCQDWQFAIVLNPQKQIWSAFNGRHSNECQGYVIDDSQDIPSTILTEDNLNKFSSG